MFDATRMIWRVSPFVLGLALLVVIPVGALPNCEQQQVLGCPAPEPEPEDEGPIPPARPGISAKTTSSLEVRWNGTNKAGLYYRLLRTGPGGTAVIASGTAPAAPVIVNDTGLLKDTSYCYLAEVDEPNVGTVSSSQICNYTLAGQAITRLEVRLTTTNVSDANTDDSVFVDISGQRTWLDHNVDDFERGASRSYDLTLVRDTADIRFVTLGKTGSNGWCVAQMELLVNGGRMFQQSFTDLPSHCLWLDNEGSASLLHHITTAELRAHPDWSTYRAPLPEITPTTAGFTGSFTFSAGELSKRIEGMVGDAIHGTALY